MNLYKCRGVTTIPALLVWLTTAAPLGAVVQVPIDDFHDAVLTRLPPGVSQNMVVPGGVTVVDTGLAGVVGGTRSLTVEATEIVVPGIDEVVAGAGFQGSFFEYRSTVCADGRITLLYDAGGAGLNLNLHQIANQELQIVVIVADEAAVPYDIAITLVDSAAHSASVTQTITESGRRMVEFHLVDFQGVDTSSLFSIEVQVDPQRAGDLRFEVFRLFTPPLPMPLLSSAALLGMALLLGTIGIAALTRSRVL